MDQNCTKIVFLMPWPISARDVDVFGFEYLKKEGFNVKVYDLSMLLHKNTIFKYPLNREIKSDYICQIDSYQALSKEIKNDVTDSIFIDSLVGLSDITLKYERIFRILGKINVKYYIVYGGASPLTQLRRGSIGVGKYIRNKIKSALHFKTLANFIANNILVLIKRHTDLYPVPSKIFSNNSDTLRLYINKYKIPEDIIVPIHSSDYDAYIHFIGHTNSKLQIDYDYCVFLDQAETHHPDYALMGMKYIDENKYYHTMNNLFNKIESKTGLKVVIAAHPRSNYGMSNVYGGRKIIKGETIGLVANSSMVVAHESTSINFAVIFNKPIMIVNTYDMEMKGAMNFTDAMAKALGLEVVNIDDDKSLNSFSYDYKKWPRDYENYRYKYIMSHDVGDLTTWDIVAKEIKKEYS